MMWSGLAARMATTSDDVSAGVRSRFDWCTSLAPALVSTSLTLEHAFCISGEFRQMSPNVFGLTTSRTHSAAAYASCSIGMWAGNIHGSDHSVTEYAQAPTSGSWYLARSSWMAALDHVVDVSMAKTLSCSTSFFMQALARAVSPGPSSQSMKVMFRPLTPPASLMAWTDACMPRTCGSMRTLAKGRPCMLMLPTLISRSVPPTSVAPPRPDWAGVGEGAAAAPGEAFADAVAGAGVLGAAPAPAPAADAVPAL